MTLELEKVKEAIESIRKKGWDVNPFTVADELEVPRSSIYRSTELMSLIIGARNGSFGLDIETSLSLAQTIQELELKLEALQTELGQLRGKENSSPPEIPVANDIASDEIFKLPDDSVSAPEPEDLSTAKWKELEELIELNLEGLDELISADEDLVANEPIIDYLENEQESDWTDGIKLEQDEAIEIKTAKDALEKSDEYKYEHEWTGSGTNQMAVPTLDAMSSDTLEAVGAEEIIEEESAPWLKDDEFLLGESGQEPEKEPGKEIETSFVIARPTFDEVAEMVTESVSEQPAEEASPELVAMKEPTESDALAGDTVLSDDTASGDPLRELIQRRIKQKRVQSAAQQKEAPAEEQRDDQEAAVQKESNGAKSLNRKKFVGTKSQEVAPSAFITRMVPPHVRKACLILGIRPEEITAINVNARWKQQIASPGVHPDLGGDNESAIYLNTAKDTLLRWLDEQSPKLGKKFGQRHKDSDKECNIGE